MNNLTSHDFKKIAKKCECSPKMVKYVVEGKRSQATTLAKRILLAAKITSEANENLVERLAQEVK